MVLLSPSVHMFGSFARGADGPERFFPIFSTGNGARNVKYFTLGG
jgi:hypothetical protein